MTFQLYTAVDASCDAAKYADFISGNRWGEIDPAAFVRCLRELSHAARENFRTPLLGFLSGHQAVKALKGIYVAMSAPRPGPRRSRDRWLEGILESGSLRRAREDMLEVVLLAVRARDEARRLGEDEGEIRRIFGENLEKSSSVVICVKDEIDGRMQSERYWKAALEYIGRAGSLNQRDLKHVLGLISARRKQGRRIPESEAERADLRRNGWAIIAGHQRRQKSSK